MKKYLADWRYAVIVFLVCLVVAGILWASFADLDKRKSVQMLASNQVSEQVYPVHLTLNGKSITWRAEVRQGRYSYVGNQPYSQVDSVLATQLLEHGMKGSYRTDYLSTTVLLVDPKRTNIDSFKQLFKQDTPVFFTADANLDRHLLSVVWATMGKLQGPTRQQLAVVLDELKHKYDKGQVYFSDSINDYLNRADKYPVAVMTDIQAAHLIQHGFPGKIVVPRDGTLTMGEGVFAADGYPLPQVRPNFYKISSLRTVEDGRIIHSASPYPPNSDYSSAILLDKQDWFPRVAQYTVSDFRRVTLGQNKLGPANPMEHNFTYLALIAVAIMWGSWISWRSPTKRLSHLFIAQVLLVVGFCLTRIAKFTTFGWGERYLWYTYYFFILANLTLMVLITEAVVGAKKSRWEKSGLVSAIGNLAVVTLVLTNDLHHLVFKISSPLETGNYTLGPGLIVVAVWAALHIMYIVFRLIGYARYVKRTLSVLLAALAVLAVSGLLLSVQLGARPIITGVEVVMFHVILIMLVSEFLMQTGLIPSNRNYLLTFSRTTVPFFLLNNNWEEVQKTRTATNIPNRILQKFKAGIDHVPAAPKLIRGTPDTPPSESDSIDYRLLRLNRGYAVVEYDMLPVQLLRAALEKTASPCRNNTRPWKRRSTPTAS